MVSPGIARAEQFVLFDVTYVHATTNTVMGHYYIKPSAETPTNWVSPINYSQGTAYFHLEVFSKPTDQGSQFHICFFGKGSNYACGPYTKTYTKPGVYDWSAKLPTFYQYNQVDWSKGLDRMPLILTDSTPVNIGVENVGAAKAALYMPTMVRVVGIMVSPGGTYVPPGPASDGGVVTSDAGARDAATTAGATDTGAAADRAAVLSVDTAAPVAADSAKLPDAAPEPDETPTPAAAKPSGGHGHGCQAGGAAPGSPTGLFLLPAVALLLATVSRRRRQ